MSQEPTFRNPLLDYAGADPWLVVHEGNYYLIATLGASELFMRKAPTLEGLKSAEPVQVWQDDTWDRCCNMWAPEIHLLDGPNGPRWYLYYTAGRKGDQFHKTQFTHVLESEGTDPLGPYSYKARVVDPNHDTPQLDGSILQMDGQLYFLVSVWEPSGQNLYIAPMSDPWTISGDRVLISHATYLWEQSLANINEGPVALQHDGQTFIIYSASGCWGPDYKLGMLTFIGTDPLDPAAWKKHPEPVFQRADENGVFGPGHNGFFKSPDGTEDWIVYHANESIHGGCDDHRTARVQRFTWNEDGTPNFGTPLPLDTDIPVPSSEQGTQP
ncbi:MAG: hypothetical protein EHM39_00130 [Chloroflexi bacterium]|nr:MAG: hypothetical protein EHM39_00130 [Chloroflexota bacterium]